MLKLSIEKEIPYPKLLIIDTPETHGIDIDNLRKMLNTMNDLDEESGFQILLSTGVNKYPEELSDNVILKLSESSMLLKAI